MSNCYIKGRIPQVGPMVYHETKKSNLNKKAQQYCETVNTEKKSIQKERPLNIFLFLQQLMQIHKLSLSLT